VEGIEQLAERLLESLPDYVWDGRSLPVPIEDIADTHLGLLVRDVEDLSRAPGAPRELGLSGLLLPDRREIWVDASEGAEWPARRRFTIAHEVGHWQLHRTADDGLFCRASDGESDDDGAIEREANEFAAALLMPATLMREHYAECRDFEEMKRRFHSSSAAMGRRLHAVIPRKPK